MENQFTESGEATFYNSQPFSSFQIINLQNQLRIVFDRMTKAVLKSIEIVAVKSFVYAKWRAINFAPRVKAVVPQLLD
jgi:hypothetical protein